MGQAAAGKGVGVGVKEVWKGAKDSKVDESRKIDESLMAVWAPFPGAALIRVSSMLAKGEWHACFFGPASLSLSRPPSSLFLPHFHFLSPFTFSLARAPRRPVGS